MIGKHRLIGANTFFSDGLKYCIKTRKEPSAKKPEKFIIQLVPGFKYISSIYPLTDNKYYMEYEGIEYEINIDGAWIEIDVK